MVETKRLIIRKFKVEDAQQLYENHIDGEVRKWFPNECYLLKLSATEYGDSNALQ